MTYKQRETIALSKINTALEQLRLNHHDEARKLFKDALSTCEKFDPNKNHLTTAMALIGVGGTYQAQIDKEGYKDLAIKYYDDALKIRLEYYGVEPRPEIANLLTNMGDTYDTSKEYEKSFYFLDRALKMKQKLYPKDSPIIADAFLKVGLSLFNQSKYNEAIEALENYLQIVQKNATTNEAPAQILANLEVADTNLPTSNHESLSQKHSTVIASVKNAIAASYGEIGNLSEELRYLKESLVIWQTLKNSEQIIYISFKIAKISMGMQNINEAADFFIVGLQEQLLAFEKYELPLDEYALIEKASLLEKVGNAYKTTGKHEDSIEFYKKAFNLYPDHKHSNATTLLTKLAEEYDAIGNYQERDNCYNDADNLIGVDHIHEGQEL